MISDAAAPSIERLFDSFVGTPEDIDELGHVNNTVWVRWIQELATRHWEAAARPQDQERFFWVVTQHIIDYRGNIGEGERAEGETWIEGEARGATSVRRVDFRNAAGRVIVSAATTWAMLDRANNRLVRVRPSVLAPFRSPET